MAEGGVGVLMERGEAGAPPGRCTECACKIQPEAMGALLM